MRSAFRAHDAVGNLLLQLLSCTGNCHAVLASEQAVAFVQRLATVLDAYLEDADKSLGKRCQALETLLQVGSCVLVVYVLQWKRKVYVSFFAA